MRFLKKILGIEPKKIVPIQGNEFDNKKTTSFTAKNDLPELQKLINSIIEYKSPEISLEKFGLNYLPEEICLPFIKSIRIGNINTKEISFPPNFKNLISLTEFHIHNTEIEEIPSELFELPSLIAICLKRNKIKKINPRISQLINLTNLNLENNSLSDFPVEIITIKNLKVL